MNSSPELAPSATDRGLPPLNGNTVQELLDLIQQQDVHCVAIHRH
jgi:hypothetical protein